MRKSFSLGLGLAGLLAVSSAGAAPSALIAASDPAAVSELELARVTASPSLLWLRARTAPHAKLALVTGADSTDNAANASAWLGALDFATRVRVTPPAGPLAACSEVTGNLADSGAPEPPVIEPSSVTTVSSEVELRRALADASLVVDPSEIAAFTANVAAPYRFALFESAENVVDTAALRLELPSSALTVPGIEVASRPSVPTTVLALAATGLEPAVVNSFAPTDFAVSYSGSDAHTNYTSARAAWLAEDPSRWLVEALGSSALFDNTVIVGVGQVEPGISQYFERVLGVKAGRACFGSVLAARARGSRLDADFVCGGADDLKLTESELDFSDLRATRLFGSLGSNELALRVSSEPARDSHVVATDLDSANCKPAAASATNGSGTVSGSHGSSWVDGTYYEGSSDVDSSSDADADGASDVDASVDSSEDNCGVTVYPESCDGDSSTSTSSGDSCSGDSSSSDGSSDSCSGDSSSSDAQSDSCSGDSSSSDAQSDSCSGDSSSSNNDDSSGCGSSGYKGDTCSGSTESSASADQASSALQAPGQKKQTQRPKKLHLSLLTLLAAGLALPLRRGAKLFASV